MPASLTQRAKRAYVKVLLSLATKYKIAADVNRDSDDDALGRFFRKLARRAHPDKGGCEADSKLLHTARDDWRAAQHSSDKAPEMPQPPTSAAAALASVAPTEKARRKAYRIQSEGVMLTYQSIHDAAQWERMVTFLEARVKGWRVKFWCATLEKCPDTQRLHVHVYLQFCGAVDRTVAPFAFEGIKPNASTNDYLGDGLCRKRLQESINRGFFYVYADKIGTMQDSSGKPCVRGNYMPCWTKCAKKHHAIHKK